MCEELTGTSFAILHGGFLEGKAPSSSGDDGRTRYPRFFQIQKAACSYQEPLSYEGNKRGIPIGLSVFSMNWWVYTKSSAVRELIPNHRFTRYTLVELV
jgi:hypothetical protein